MDLQLVQLAVNGATVGCIIALAAAGLTLTYGILRLSNFAHGDLMTLGAYGTLWVNQLRLNIWPSLLVGMATTIGANLLSEWAIWRPMRDRRSSPTTLIVISIGWALVLRNGIIFLWGGDNQSYRLPVAPALDVLGIKVRFYSLVTIALATVVVGGLYYLLQKTKIGKAMRAVADDTDLARVTGINVEAVVIWTWVIAGGLTALSGGLYGLVTGVRPNMGWFLILPMFAAVILGGIGNPYGAIVGGLAIGIAQEMSTYWLPTEYKPAVALVATVLVLLFRPQGLFRGTT